MHVIDKVLLPARSIQSILPYSLAVGGVPGAPAPGAPPGPPGSAAGGIGIGSASLEAGLSGAPADGGAPAPQGGGGQPACFGSLADAIATTPQLSIFRSTLGLSGVGGGGRGWSWGCAKLCLLAAA